MKSLRLGKKFIPVSEKPSCRNKKFQPRPVSDLSHMLHQAIEFLAEDEIMEVTPQSIRLRKTELDHSKLKKPVCSGFARFKSNQRTVCPARNIPFVGLK